MSGYPGFGVLLARLLQRRELGIADLARLTAIPAPELLAVLDGAPPDSPLLRRLGPALSLHTADLFVIASVPVPEQLSPLDPRAGRLAAYLAQDAVRLPAKARTHLRDFARSLPQYDRTQPVQAPPPWRQYQPGFGSVLARLLENRNLDWLPAVRTLAVLTDLGLSAATIGVIGRGEKQLTPGLVAAFATILGIPAGDLAALGDIELPDSVSPPDRETSDVASLIWEVRRLTIDQVQQVIDEAASIAPE